MNEALVSKLEKFAELVDLLYDDILLDRKEQVEHRTLQFYVEQFTLAAKGETTLEESPVNLARSLFVQICRMSLTRGRRAVFLEKADEIEREASQIPYTASLYLNPDELRAIASAVDIELFDNGWVGSGAPLERACRKLKNLVSKLENSRSVDNCQKTSYTSLYEEARRALGTGQKGPLLNTLREWREEYAAELDELPE